MFILVPSTPPSSDQRLKLDRRELPRVLIGLAATAIIGIGIYQFLPDFKPDRSKLPAYMQQAIDECAAYVTRELPQVTATMAHDRCAAAARDWRQMPTRAGVMAIILSDLRTRQLEEQMQLMREKVDADKAN